MDPAYVFFADLARELEIPANGLLSRTLYQDAKVKVVFFGFAAGEEMSDHTSTSAAIMHFVGGEGTVTLGDDNKEVASGTWIHMAPNLRHSIRAKTPLRLLLLLLRG